MKCHDCKFSKNSNSKSYKYYCTKFTIHCLDDMCGCKDGEEKEIKKEVVKV